MKTSILFFCIAFAVQFSFGQYREHKKTFDYKEYQYQVGDRYDPTIAGVASFLVPGSQKTIEAEFGDVLFSMINYARFLNINPDTALERTNQKFSKRFTYLEAKAKELGKSLQDMTLAEMDVLWDEAKKLD